MVSILKCALGLVGVVRDHACADKTMWLCAVLAYAIASVSPNMDVANAALPAYVTSLLFFVGLLLRIQDQPNYWKWCVHSAPLPEEPTEFWDLLDICVDVTRLTKSKYPNCALGPEARSQVQAVALVFL